MNIYESKPIKEYLEGNSYVGRGIAIGRTEDGKCAAVAYFIMGRSENSRSRVFVKRDGAVFTQPSDPAKVKDPSLVIYAAVRELEGHLVVTNGDHTDTICEALQRGESFTDALAKRTFEPDPPNLTPRISALLSFSGGDFAYQMGILKSIDPEGTGCVRNVYAYPSKPGLGHFIHTYVTDGTPLPSFQGEPERIKVPDDIGQWTDEIWENLDKENRISLYVRYVRLSDGAVTERLINKNTVGGTL